VIAYEHKVIEMGGRDYLYVAFLASDPVNVLDLEFNSSDSHRFLQFDN
jgi:hypothetical protein